MWRPYLLLVALFCTTVIAVTPIVQGRCSTPSLISAPDGVICTTPVIHQPVGVSHLSIDGNTDTAWISTLVVALVLVGVVASASVLVIRERLSLISQPY